MKAVFTLIFASLLLAACISTPSQAPEQPAPQAPPGQPPEEPAPTCLQYCESRPHIQCVGQWNITGAYPDCVCSFECDIIEEEPAPEPPPADEPLAEPTDKSVPEFLDEGLEDQKNDFYLSHDGSFTERTYTWLRQSPSFEEGVMAPASDVLFDGEPIESIRASGFTVFEDNSDNSMEAYGISIFKDQMTALDGYTGSDDFDIDYFPDLIDKELKDCQVYSKDLYLDEENDWMATYHIRCESALDK
ncbi:MAG: hypothetical protein V1827_05445 [Candidatus Micrarchaeota archaeon]